MFLDAHFEEDRKVGLFAGIFASSLLLHLLFFIVAFALAQSNFSKTITPPQAKPLMLKVVKIPPSLAELETNPNTRLFADTADSIPTKQALPTPFEGEISTLASSTQKGTGNAALPNQTGVDIKGLTLRNQDYSPETESKLNPQAQAQESQKPQQPDTQSEKSKQDLAKAQPQPIPLRSSGQVNFPDKIKPPQELEKQELSSATKSAMATQRVPFATFSAQKQATTITGGARIGDTASLGVQESEMGRYKAKLYRAIGSRWYIYVRDGAAQVSVGIVKIRFKVSSTGEISDLETSQGDSFAALQAISRRAILDLRNQLDPFPQSMQEQLGDYYWEEVTFTIY